MRKIICFSLALAFLASLSNSFAQESNQILEEVSSIVSNQSVGDVSDLQNSDSKAVDNKLEKAKELQDLEDLQTLNQNLQNKQSEDLQNAEAKKTEPDDKVDYVLQKAESEIYDYKNNIDEKINKYKNIVNEDGKKVRNIIDVTEKSMIKYGGTKEEFLRYINMIKTAAIISVLGIIGLLLIFWRIWSSIVALKKIVKNVSSYHDFDRRLRKIEMDIRELKSNNLLSTTKLKNL